MKMDIDGLDGVLFSSSRNAEKELPQKRSHRRAPARPQKPAALSVMRTRKSRIKVPDTADVSLSRTVSAVVPPVPKKRQLVEKPPVNSNGVASPPSAPARMVRSVQPQSGRTLTDIPVVSADDIVAKDQERREDTRPLDLHSVLHDEGQEAAFSSNDPVPTWVNSDQEQESGRGMGRSWRFVAVAASLALIFVSGVVLMTRTKKAPPKPVTPLATSTQMQNMETSATRGVPGIREVPVAAATVDDEIVSEVPIEVAQENDLATNERYFPGQYRKGDVYPKKVRWGIIDDLFKTMRTCKGEIVISGHACAMGDEATNVYVSERRAKIISKYFIKRGFSKKRLRVQGMGSSEPLVENESVEGGKANRRVEIRCR